MKRMRLVFALMLMVACAGCTHVKGYVDIAKDKGISDEYIAALKQWTRSKTVHSEFETKASITATYKTPAFNQAYLNEYARLHRLTGDEKKAREDLQSGLSADFMEFFFYAAIPDKEANDFAKPNPSWTIFILDQKGTRIYPTEIRKIRKITPAIETFYPYVNPYYGMCYSLKFPPQAARDAASGPLKLVFAGVIGQVELEWTAP